MDEKIEQLTTEIEELKWKNNEFRIEMDKMRKISRELCDSNNEIILHMSKTIGDMTTFDINLNIIRARSENLRYELLDPRLDKNNYYFPDIRGNEETMLQIKENGKSMARFGDAEYSIIFNIYRHKYQRLDCNLALRLKEVLHSHHPNMLIAIADNYGALEKYTDHAADAIRFYMAGGETRKQHMELLEPDRTYYDAYISRPYVMYRDSDTNASKMRFDRWKEVWKGRKVIIIEGAQTRMGVGNDLLSDAKSIKRVLGPATSSFDCYDEILESALRFAEKDSLFLIAMGPSAGVLAYDLTIAGCQALDVGHLDLEYEWHLAGKRERVPVPHKYNNEVAGDEDAKDIEDPLYGGQIVARHKKESVENSHG